MRSIKVRGIARLVVMLSPLAGCGAVHAVEPAAEPVVMVVETENDLLWKEIAKEKDIGRIAAVADAWQRALADARLLGHSAKISAEGQLLEPTAALPRPAPAPGSYMCRIIKLGATDRAETSFATHKPYFCYVGVESDLLALTKQAGSERPGGYLYHDHDPHRLIFLGAMATGIEELPLAYGTEDSRDLAGVFERVAPFRYRLVMPALRGAATLDILELVPAPVQLAG